MTAEQANDLIDATRDRFAEDDLGNSTIFMCVIPDDAEMMHISQKAARAGDYVSVAEALCHALIKSGANYVPDKDILGILEEMESKVHEYAQKFKAEHADTFDFDAWAEHIINS